jgi:hypothetical protein
MIVIARNHNELWWDIDPVGNISLHKLIEWCTGNPGTPIFGTIWNVISCNSTGLGAVRLAPDVIQNDNDGLYENFNWGYMADGTWVELSSQVKALNNETFHYGWSYDSWGESARLLAGYVYVNK